MAGYLEVRIEQKALRRLAVTSATAFIVVGLLAQLSAYASETWTGTVNRAALLAATGKVVDAERLLEAVKSETSDPYGIFEVNRLLAGLHVQDKKYAEAEQELQACLELAKKFDYLDKSETAKELADLYKSMGKISQASSIQSTGAHFDEKSARNKPDILAYLKLLERAAKERWHPPRPATITPGKWRTVCNWLVDSAGNFVDVHVVKSSGNGELDQQAVLAAMQVHNVGKLPVSGSKYIEINYSFDYNCRSRLSKGQPKPSATGSHKSFLGGPPNPMNRPDLASDPRAWFDYLGYYLEISIIAFSITLLITATDLAFLKEKKWAWITGLAVIPNAVFGLAVPGLLIMADERWLHSVNDRFVLISVIQFVWSLVPIIFLGIPIAVAFFRKRSTKRKWLVAGLSLAGMLLTIFWIVAIHFAVKANEDITKADGEVREIGKLHKWVFPLAGLIVPTVIAFGLALLFSSHATLMGLASLRGRALIANSVLLFGPGLVGLLSGVFIAIPFWKSDRVLSIILWVSSILIGSVISITVAVSMTP